MSISSSNSTTAVIRIKFHLNLVEMNKIEINGIQQCSLE